MNESAEQHLAKAKDYVARGEEFYRKAADEIIEAEKADPTLTWAEAARRIKRSEDWVADIVRWRTTPEDRREGRTPWAADSPARTERAAKQVARENPAAIIADPEARREIGRALDEHYTEQAKKSATHRRDKEVERKGGENEYTEHQERHQVAEVVNVARGATSGWRFVAGQVRALTLDAGATEELAALADETEGFVSMLRSLLRGEEITDAALAALIGEES